MSLSCLPSCLMTLASLLFLSQLWIINHPNVFLWDIKWRQWLGLLLIAPFYYWSYDTRWNKCSLSCASQNMYHTQTEHEGKTETDITQERKYKWHSQSLLVKKLVKSSRSQVPHVFIGFFFNVQFTFSLLIHSNVTRKQNSMFKDMLMDLWIDNKKYCGKWPKKYCLVHLPIASISKIKCP